MALIDEGITNECACARGIGEKEEENADGRRRRRDDGDEEEEEVGDLLVEGREAFVAFGAAEGG